MSVVMDAFGQEGSLWDVKNPGVRPAIQELCHLGQCLNFSGLSFPVCEMEVMLPAGRSLKRDMVCLAQSPEHVARACSSKETPPRPVGIMLVHLCSYVDFLGKKGLCSHYFPLRDSRP